MSCSSDMPAFRHVGQMYNSDFKVVEFDHFKMQAGLPSFVLGP